MWDLLWIVKGFSLCALVSPLVQASCYSLSPLMVLFCVTTYCVPGADVILCHHLWCSWSRPALFLAPPMVFLDQMLFFVTTFGVPGAHQLLFSVTTYGVPEAGQLLFLALPMVFLEQASCYSLSPLMVFLKQASCYSLSPFIVFLIAQATIFSPRNFISCLGNYLILNKDWGSGALTPDERIQEAAKWIP